MTNLLIRTKYKHKEKVDKWTGEEYKIPVVSIYYSEYIIEPHLRKDFFEWLKQTNMTLVFEESTDKPRTHRFSFKSGKPELVQVVRDGIFGEYF